MTLMVVEVASTASSSGEIEEEDEAAQGAVPASLSFTVTLAELVVPTL